MVAKEKRQSVDEILAKHIFRPDIHVLGYIAWATPENSDLREHWGTAPKLINEFVRLEEDEYLFAIAVSRNLVKLSAVETMSPQKLPDGWQRDLLVNLARELYPQFAGIPRSKVGVPKKPHEWDLLAQVDAKVRAGHSQLNACRLLSDDKKSRWHKQGTKALNERINRMREFAAAGNGPAMYEQFNKFSRKYLGLPGVGHNSSG